MRDIQQNRRECSLPKTRTAVEYPVEYRQNSSKLERTR